MVEIIKNSNLKEFLTVVRGKECPYTRQQLLDFKNSDFDNAALERILNDPEIIFKNVKIKESLIVPVSLLIHKAVPTTINNYSYKLICQEKNNRVISAKIIGHRFRNNQPETIFACACCGKTFRINHLAASLLRFLYPEFKGSIYPKVDDILYHEYSLLDVLRLFANICSCDDFFKLVSWSDVVQKEIEKNKSTLYHFYTQHQRTVVEK